MRNLISLIIPVYNTACYLQRCIDSVMSQDYENLEVIIVNDGSTDNSESIIYENLKVHSNIRYVKQENLGVGAARNRGIKEARGEYIGFIDSDDTISQNYCSYLREIIRDAEIAVAGRRKYIDGIYEKSKTAPQILKVSGVDALRYLMLGQFNSRPAWGKLFKRSIIKQTAFIEGCIFEEVRYSADTFAKAEKVVFADKDLYFYKVRYGSIMTSNEEVQVKELPLALIYVYNLISNQKIYEQCELEFKIWLLRVITQNIRLLNRCNIDIDLFKKYTGLLVNLYDQLGGLGDIFINHSIELKKLS